ncbi:hypothetical protein QVD17_09479 [Tagetes erecta]|uniref:RING-type domain-containing protein n=1 Tax=Tagetes erecta TaxID=13708 RepID=A0AAD8L627_TARER|nr:hypothetical protein QVD17_09479 [Tagetes erecta]
MKNINNVDLSWLPNHNHKTFTNESHHHSNHPQTDSDDSWLPNYNQTNTKHSSPPSKSTNSNPQFRQSKTERETEKVSDDSWLPSAPISTIKNENIINHSRNSHIQNCKKTVSTKPNNSIVYQKTETSSGCVLNKRPECSTKVSPARSECSVETDSLGGVSTLLRRWKDVETKNTNGKTKSLKADESLKSKDGSFGPVIGRTRMICGRQAFIDFFKMVERDKRRELDSLNQRKSVSKFSSRGRIEVNIGSVALLRVRLIRVGGENQKEAKSHKHSVSRTMKSIWDKISTGVKHDTPESRKVNNNAEGIKKSNTCPEYSVDCNPAKELTATTTAVNSQELQSTASSHQLAQEPKEDTHCEILVPNTADCHEKSQYLSAKTYENALVECIPGLENCHNWISECSQTQSDWDDDDDESYSYNYNWISEIARPRSDWECMRQKRYQEMLHHSYNQDIQQLLQRKSVSGFLSSDQRNALDQLMMSRTQGVSRTESRKEDEFIDQTACSSPPTQSSVLEQSSENHHQHQHQHHPHSYLQNNNNNNRQSSVINHSSVEMGLIYDLRVYVEQIHQEVMELRKAVTSCVNMQVKNQHQSSEPYILTKCNTGNVSVANGSDFLFTAQKKRRQQASMTRNCCVCYAVQADSFLYRCGHMCTCYDCGLELQCTSGRCPICEEVILDVVKTYAYGDSVVS